MAETNITFTHTCPHCHTKNAGFTGISQTDNHTRGMRRWNIYLTCNGCRGGIIALVTDSYDRGPFSRGSANLNDAHGGILVFHVFPEGEATEAPDDVPERTALVFEEAADNLNQGRFETCAMLCRKTMDLATKALRGEASQREQLYDRIEALQKEGVITADMAKWAHAVRLDGRDAVHDADPFTQEEADDLMEFTRAFLMYGFTLPAMVARRNREQA